MSSSEQEDVQLMDTLISGDHDVQTVLKDIREKCEKRYHSAPQHLRRDRHGRMRAPPVTGTDALRDEASSPPLSTSVLDSADDAALHRRRGRWALAASPTRYFSGGGLAASKSPDGWCCSFRQCCTRLFGPVYHPEGRARSMWNVCLAFLILYCGISVPLEIAMEKGTCCRLSARGTCRCRIVLRLRPPAGPPCAHSAARMRTRLTCTP